jgi:hypothetical protein
MAGENQPIPVPTALEKLAADPRYEGGVWMLIDLDLTRIDPTPKRVNISLPGSLLSQIDSYAQTCHLTRSGFLFTSFARSFCRAGSGCGP